jgi:5-methylcytosine-specific restriction endonuclease McrA
MLKDWKKVCIKCKLNKELCLFSKHSRSKDGLQQTCKKCVNEYSIANKNKISAYKKAYNAKNKDKNALRAKKWVEENKEYYVDARKKYYQKYKKTDKAKAVYKNASHKRRISKSDGDLTSEQLLTIEKSAKNCYWCGIDLNKRILHLDHYIPLSKGGKHTESNIVPSCAKCNMAKGSMMPDDFKRKLYGKT